MKYLFLVFLFFGCSTKQLESNQQSVIFDNNNSVIFSENVISLYFDNDATQRNVLEGEIKRIQTKIDAQIALGKRFRKFNIERQGKISKEYCVDAAFSRERKAEIVLLLEFAEKEEWLKTRDIVRKKIDLLDKEITQLRQGITEELSDNEITQKLANLLAEDQAYNRLIYWKNLQGLSQPMKKYLQSLRNLRLCEFKLRAASSLRKIFKETDGWPTISQYGKDADRAAFVVMHNIFHDLDLLESSLKQIEFLYPQGETNLFHYPNLYDIVANYKGEKQKFGWIIRCVDGEYKPSPPLLNEDKVNEFRAEFGLSTLEQSISRFPKTCDNN